MYNRIEDFVDILYNLVRAAVYLNWGDFNNQLSNMRDWFEGFIDEVIKEIQKQVKALRDYVTPWINYLDSWADWVNAEFTKAWKSITDNLTKAYNYAYDIVDDNYKWATTKFNDTWNTISSNLTKAYNYAYDIVDDNYKWATARFNDLWNYINQSINIWIDWLRAIKITVDWYVYTVRVQIGLFLANPLGFILGDYALKLIAWLIWLEWCRTLLVAFTEEVMADVYNFWHLHAKDLRAFMTDPAGWILLKMKVSFFDWLFTLLDEVW